MDERRSDGLEEERRLGRTKDEVVESDEEQERDRVTEASEESFPASDAPSWIGGGIAPAGRERDRRGTAADERKEPGP
jgi:hypothetical protein